jgi:phosphomannomutase
MLSLLAMSVERGCALSQLTAGVPSRYTASDRLQGFASTTSDELLSHLVVTPGAVQAFFSELGEVADINTVDGLRVTLRGGDIAHLRPSGNAPELRCYAEAGTPERARELSRWALAAAVAKSRSLQQRA